jgi:uncharacterized protein (TIGR02145 family)
MKHIFKNLSTLLFLLIGIPLFLTSSCSGDDGRNGINGIEGNKGDKGDEGIDGTGCNFGEDGKYYVMTCNETEKARWAKAYCGATPYNPAEMECNINHGILSFYFTDERNSETYRALIIGSQIWMAENLNYAAEGSKCYANNPANCNKHGGLYDWETAKEVCPEGWHLPSREDWTELIFVVGSEKTAGTILKTTSGWNENGNGTDELGFATLPGGLYSDGDFFSVIDADILLYLQEFYPNGDFFGSYDYGFWWSATELENDKSKAYLRTIAYDKASFDMALGNKTNLLSVRCIED